MKQNVLLYALAAAGGVILTLFAYCGYQEWQNGKLRELAAEYKRNADQYLEQLRHNEAEFAKAEAIAFENIEAAKREQQAAETAAAQARDSRDAYKTRLQEIVNGSVVLVETVEGDCDAAADPDFIASLRNP